MIGTSVARRGPETDRTGRPLSHRGRLFRAIRRKRGRLGGRWLAYRSDESGKGEIYIKKFPSAEGKWQPSVDGGYSPLWSKSGDEIFFWELGNLMVVGVEASENSLTLSRPKSLFSRGDSNLRSGNHYDISADGARFVMIQQGVAQDAEEDATPPTVVLVQNWFAEFQDRQ